MAISRSAIPRELKGNRKVAKNTKTVKRATGGSVSKNNWIQRATASINQRGTKGVCTGKKFGSKTCPPGSKRYNLARTFKKMSRRKT
tara:strand:+ start:26 stop:286 length:261 start_codon:yes stop_codon:yes gene_type:complete